MVTIRRCRADDVPDLLVFLDLYWKPNHIFTKDRALFDWQHSIRHSPGEYSFAIARRDADNELLGILGYVPTKQFDAALAGANTVWLTLWKVRDDVETGGLGLRLVRFVMQAEPHVAVGVLGFQPDVRALYRALGFSVGEMRHYVLPNPDVARFELAILTTPSRAIVRAPALTATIVDDSTLSRLATLDVADRDSQAPRKTTAYFRARYLQHPIYKYTCLALYRGSRPIGLLALRAAC